MRNEPLINIAFLTALVTALLSLLTAFGVPITDAQQDAVNQFMLVVAPLLVAFIGRTLVTPVAEPKDHDGVPLVRIDGQEPGFK